jgi:tRNA/tmRNA/rRNA uracil-C5-methylase (TrmA/RlmC/RlmD family)
MLAAGFKLLEVQPVDLFPQTPHVELLVQLRRPS